MNRKPGRGNGPFGLGPQGYLLVAVVILASAACAATRPDWTSMVLSAVLLPAVMFGIIWLITSLRTENRRTPPGSRGATPAALLDFLARTNPLMFLLAGAYLRRSDEVRYQELLRSGPYALGARGFGLALLLLLTPLLLTLLFVAATGSPPHGG